MFKQITCIACLLVTTASAGEPTAAIPAMRPSELLTTVEAVETHVKELIEQRKAMTNYAVELSSQSSNTDGEVFFGASRTWVHGDNLREDCANGDTTEIFTPTHNIQFEDGKWNYRAGDGKRGWTAVPDYSRFGISDRWEVRAEESHEDYLLPKNRKNVKVEIGEYENHKVTIVKFDQIINKADAWTEYRLSPKYGNNPVFLQYGWVGKDRIAIPKTLISMSIRWKNYDGIWFPERLTRVRREPEKKPERRIYNVKRARFNLQPFPDVFSPEATFLKFRQTTEEVESGQ